MYHTATVKGGLSIRPVLFCGNITKAQEAALDRLGYSVFRLPPDRALPHPVASHPDMLCCRLPSGKLFLCRNYYEANKKALLPFSNSLVLAEETLGESYPDDVKLNAFAVGKTLFGGKNLSRALMAHYNTTVFVKQGYANCSAARVGKGVITADRSLYQALVANGVDTLLIRSGHIALDPYDTGFIGGASLFLSENLTAFFGKIEDHPDYGAMLAFAQAQNATLLSLSDEPLSDFGGGYLIT